MLMSDIADIKIDVDAHPPVLLTEVRAQNTGLRIHATRLLKSQALDLANSKYWGKKPFKQRH
jgi:hypothetical protein